MKKANLICYVFLLTIFIPYEGALQYVSHVLLLGLIVVFYDYFKVKPIILIYLYGFIIFGIQVIFFDKDVFITNYLISVLYAPLLILLSPSSKLYDEVKLNVEHVLKVLFFLYALILWYQALNNWWTPESVGGVHGIIKGPHLNAQLYLLLSGYFLFRNRGPKDLVTAFIFLLTALLCDYNLGTVIYLFTILAVISSQFNFRKSYLKYALGGLILLLVTIGLIIRIADERSYLFEMVLAIANNANYSGKLSYLLDFGRVFSVEDPFTFFFGTGPGNGGSRSALLLTGEYIKFNLPHYLVGESFYVKDYVYPYLYGVSNVARGTINQPFSSLVAILTEFGILIGLTFLVFISKGLRRFKWKSNMSTSFIFWNLIIWVIVSHSFELLPFIILTQLLLLANYEPK